MEAALIAVLTLAVIYASQGEWPVQYSTGPDIVQQKWREGECWAWQQAANIHKVYMRADPYSGHDDSYFKVQSTFYYPPMYYTDDHPGDPGGTDHIGVRFHLHVKGYIAQQGLSRAYINMNFYVKRVSTGTVWSMNWGKSVMGAEYYQYSGEDIDIPNAQIPYISFGDKIVVPDGLKNERFDFWATSEEYTWAHNPDILYHPSDSKAWADFATGDYCIELGNVSWWG